MKLKITLSTVLAAISLALTGCASRKTGPLVTPNEFLATNPSMDSRAALIRNANPNLSKDEAAAQAGAEYAASAAGTAKARHEKQKAAQKAFERDLAKSLGSDGK